MAEKTTKVQQLRTEIAELLKEQYLEIARKMASQTREPEAYKALYDVPAEGLTFLNGAYEWAEDTASEEAKAVQDFAGGEVARYLLRTLNHKAAEPCPPLPDDEPWAPVERAPEETDLCWAIRRLAAQCGMKECKAYGIEYSSEVFGPTEGITDGLQEWADMDENRILDRMTRHIAEDFEQYDDIIADNATADWDTGRTAERGD